MNCVLYYTSEVQDQFLVYVWYLLKKMRHMMSHFIPFNVPFRFALAQINIILAAF